MAWLVAGLVFGIDLVALRKLPSPNSLATACSRKVEIGDGNGYWSENPITSPILYTSLSSSLHYLNPF